MKKTQYRIWALILRSIVILIPCAIAAIFNKIGGKADDLTYWLSDKLPDPRIK